MPPYGRLVLLLTAINYADCLNILAIISLPLGSHYMAFKTLFSELAVRGHTVTVMNNFPDDNPPKNLNFINLKASLPYTNNTPTLEDYEKLDSSYLLHLYNFLRHLTLSPTNARYDCENLFENPDVQKHFASERKYDVIFVEQFMCDCALAYAVVMYDAPIIGITSHVMLPWSYPRMGIPFNLATDAFYFSGGGRNPTLYHKVETAILNFFITTIGKRYIQRSIYEVFDRYAPNRLTDLEKMARDRMRMMFVYQHHSVTGARLLAPRVLEIGGIHIVKPKEVPSEIEAFLADAEHGAIYVSFGSYLKPSTMSKSRIDQFWSAFLDIPQKVLWKLENTTSPHKKVLTKSWFPQLDILCHPKVVGFVSHGGMLGTSEAAHCGKPMVVIPFFGDQFSNAAALQQVGLGIRLFLDRINSRNLAEAIARLASPEMRKKAQQISREWHDRPLSAIDSAVFWTEYVARHKSAPPALPEATWFQSSLIDVYAVLIMMCFVIVAILYVIFKSVIAILKLMLYRKKAKRD